VGQTGAAGGANATAWVMQAPPPAAGIPGLVRRVVRPEGALLISGLPARMRMGMELNWRRELASGRTRSSHRRLRWVGAVVSKRALFWAGDLEAVPGGEGEEG
jgi:hypothetical protein